MQKNKTKKQPESIFKLNPIKEEIIAKQGCLNSLPQKKSSKDKK